MAICCAGKKQKVSHPVTTSLNHRNSSDKHNGHVDHHHPHQLRPNSSIRHRSHSHFHHPTTHSNHCAMPHDLSRSTGNSASSSALTYTFASPATNKPNPKSVPMDLSDDDDDDEDEDQRSTKKKPNGKLPPTIVKPTAKQLIVHADMIFYCFEILGNYLFNGKHHHLGKFHSPSASTNGQLVPSALQPPALPIEPYPLFVTWLIGSEQKLRGCIGTFTPMNLAQGKTKVTNGRVGTARCVVGLREYAITSATNDSRFSPISRDEYPFLSCAVSILTNFEPCASIGTSVYTAFGSNFSMNEARNVRRPICPKWLSNRDGITFKPWTRFCAKAVTRRRSLPR